MVNPRVSATVLLATNGLETVWKLAFTRRSTFFHNKTFPGAMSSSEVTSTSSGVTLAHDLPSSAPNGASEALNPKP